MRTSLSATFLWGLIGSAEAVSNGRYHSCTAFDDGSVKCWGYNANGQLGLGDLEARGVSSSQMGDSLPEVNLGRDFLAAGVSAGYDHTCAITRGGEIKCWGGNAYGQLGYGDTTERGGNSTTMGDNLEYVDIGTGVTALKIVAGHQFTCALLADHTLKCFGRNDAGQLGTGLLDHRGDGIDEMGDALIRVDLSLGTASVVDMSSGPCVVFDTGGVKCWGSNNHGQLGRGDMENVGDEQYEMGSNLTEIDLGTNASATAVASGTEFTCVLLDVGSVKCWGRNTNGQCGGNNVETYGDDPDEMGDNLPTVDLGTGRTAISITAAEAHVCVVLDDDSIKCWGKGYYGALGVEDWRSYGVSDGQMGNDLPTVDVGTSAASARRGRRERRGLRRGLQESGSGGVSYLTSGGDRSCVIMDGGSVKCWGNGWAGSLGSGNSDDRGERSGSMGDNLPTISLGEGKVAIPPEDATIPTPAPTGQPTIAPTLSPSRMPTTAPVTPAPTKAPTEAPLATPGPTPVPTIASTVRQTRAPVVTSAPTSSAILAQQDRDGIEGFADDVGLTVTQAWVIAIAVPLGALFVCCFAGFLVAKRNKRDETKSTATRGRESSTSDTGSAAAVGPALVSTSVPEKTAPVAPAFCAVEGPSGKSGDDGNENSFRDHKIPHTATDANTPPNENTGEDYFPETNGTRAPMHGGGAPLVGIASECNGSERGGSDKGNVGRAESGSETPPQSWDVEEQYGGVQYSESSTPRSWGDGERGSSETKEHMT